MTANDLLYCRWQRITGLNGKRIDNPNTHGTGCTLIYLQSLPIWQKAMICETAVERAKEYISGALAAMLDLGAGSGPMDHGFGIHNEFTSVD